MTPRIGLVGFFGWGNFGDEVMLQCWRRALGSASAEPVNALTQRPYFDRPAAAVARDVDALIIGGGDLLHTDSISSLYWNRAWLEKPIIISGIGVALEQPRERHDVIERLRVFFSSPSVRSISARDSASASWIRERLVPAVEVQAIPDLAFAAEMPAVTPPSSDVMRIVLRKTPSERDIQEVRRLRSWAESAGLDSELLILAIGEEAAREAAAVRSAIPEVPLRTEPSLQELMRAISTSRLLVTAKFHGAVIAARAGVPSVSLRATHKIEALARLLEHPDIALPVHDADDGRLRDILQRRPPRDAVMRAEHAAARAVNRAAAQALAS